MTYFFKFPTVVPNSDTVIDVYIDNILVYKLKYDVPVYDVPMATMSPSRCYSLQ